MQFIFFIEEKKLWGIFSLGGFLSSYEIKIEGPRGKTSKLLESIKEIEGKNLFNTLKEAVGILKKIEEGYKLSNASDVSLVFDYLAQRVTSKDPKGNK